MSRPSSSAEEEKAGGSQRNEHDGESKRTAHPATDGFDAMAEKRLVRKLDWTMLPLFLIIYCSNFIDRTAIGNAKIAGIEKDLGLVGFDYNIALTIFYVFYILSEIPSNLILKHVGSMWMAAMVTSFGVVSIGTAFVHSFSGLVATRVFLGIAEGGTLSGLTYILSRYYTRKELVLRLGIFFGLSPPLAGGFGGLLASGLLSLPDIGSSLHTWRKIFFVEGIITTGIGLVGFIIIPGDPEHSRMLSAEERALALSRIDRDRPVKSEGHKEKTSLKLIIRAFNINTMVCAISYLMINISFQGLSLFMPTVIATLGHFTTVESQLRTVPPYMVGAVWAVVSCYYSCKARQRALPTFVSTLLIVAGYGIAVGTRNSQARYAACFLSIMGGSPTAPQLLAWGTDNSAPDTVRAVTTAIIPGIGALGSIIAVWTYLPSDAPNYHKGNSLNVATSSATCVLILLGALYIYLENRKRDRGEYRITMKGKSSQEIEQLGHLHPNFRYQI